MPALRSSNLRRRNVLVAVGALVILQVFAIVVSGVAARESSIAAARDGIVREGATTTESILRHLEPAEQSVEISARLLESDLIDRSTPGLEQYLFTQLAVMPQVTGAFVGYPNGEFVFVAVEGDGYRTKRIAVEPERVVEIKRYNERFELSSTEIVLDDDFDPTTRPWFEGAIASDGLSWSDPYVFFSSQQPGVTASAVARVDGEVLAVVGVDVELSGLAMFLDDLNISEDGEAFVVSGNKVIGAPSSYRDRVGVGADGEIRLLTAAEVGVPQFDSSLRSEVRRVETESGADLVLHRDVPADQGVAWAIVVRAPEASFTAVSEAQQRTMLLVTLGGGLLVLLGGLALLRVSRPIAQVQTWAATDSLTGLANRRSIDGQGAEMLARLNGGDVLSVLLLDLDGFKGLNDRHGHHTGDRALIIVGSLLAERTGREDLVGRLGGDEFVIVRRVPHVAAAVEGANRLMDSLRSRLASEFPYSPVGVSAGLTVGSESDADFPVVLMEADTALMTAKSDYKGMLRLADRLVQASM